MKRTPRRHRILPTNRLLMAAAVVTATLFVLSTTAFAATPTTTSVEGVLTSAGGGAAADGMYALTFSIYDGKTATKASWVDGPVQIKVVSGRFQARLGLGKPLSGALLSGLKSPWFGIKVGADPELPRQPLNSTPYALAAGSLSCSGCIGAAQLASSAIPASKIGFTYAGSTTKGGAALNLVCTGCVSVKEMKFDADVNLVGNSIKAKNGVFSGDLAASTVTASSFVGDGSKLTGIKIPKGSCTKAGEVVAGINTDGTLQCVLAVDASKLPKDGIDEISNGLLNNQFQDTISATVKNVPIPDFTGTDAVSDLTFPDIGMAQAFSVYVHLENTDLSNITMVLLPPNDKKTGYTLCDPCGVVDAKILKRTWSPKLKPKTGDLGAWIGKNPKGLWNLKVIDSKFCVAQVSANAKYCSLAKKTDGWIADWTIQVTTLSTKKVGVAGNLVLASATAPCDRFALGAIKFSAALKRVQVCDGQQWWPQLLGAVSSAPGRSCKDIKARAPTVKSGVYWIDPDGSGKVAPFKVYCDQERGGGGWTLVVKVKGNDKGMNRLNTAQWRQKKLIGSCENTNSENALCTGYDKVAFTDVMIRSLARPSRNLAWGHRDAYASMWAVVNAGKRIYTRNRLFGAVGNLDYNGNRIYHRECAGVTYGFFVADSNLSYNTIAGHTGLVAGHAGGVLGASINDWSNWATLKEYGKTDFLTTRCLTAFAVGGGYANAAVPNDDAYAINAHWWGAGNTNTNSWNSHGVFVR